MPFENLDFNKIIGVLLFLFLLTFYGGPVNCVKRFKAHIEDSFAGALADANEGQRKRVEARRKAQGIDNSEEDFSGRKSVVNKKKKKKNY